mgnify:CR=1 FL=1
MRLLCVLVLAAVLGLAGGVQAAHGDVHATTLGLTVVHLAVGESSTISAHLQDDGGEPVVDAVVSFERETTFGWLSLGDRATNSDGNAFLSYVPETPGTYSVRARYDGGPNLLASAAVSSVTVPGPSTEAPFPTDTAIAFVVAIIVGSIWGAYAFVLLDLRGIWVAGGGVPRFGRRRAGSR